MQSAPSSPDSDTERAVRASFAQQAIWCRELGSPFTAMLLDTASRRLDRATALGRRILSWPGAPDARHEALSLRFAGALNALARSGRLPALTALYPPNPTPDEASLWDAVARGLEDAGDALDRWLNSAPQTNEVARSAALMAGLMVVSGETRLPLALYELGASAGLNLVPDRYACRLGGVQAGAADSSVILAPDWRGPPPRAAEVRITRRRGVDLNPLDATLPADRERLLAFIWPDQTARLARTQAALALVAADPPCIDTGDAADWTEAHIQPTPHAGIARVLMHSIAFQYFPAVTQGRIARHAALVGGQATKAGPFAWLRFESDPAHGDRPSLRLAIWPGGTDRLLATGSSHGYWIEWLANEGDRP